MKLIAVNDAGSQETIDRPQDVRFYLSAEEAEGSFESWFSAYPHLAVDSDGVRYAFSTVGDRLALTRVPGETANPGLYRAFAEHMLRHYFANKLCIEPDLQPNLDELSIDNLNALVYAHIMSRKQEITRRANMLATLRWSLLLFFVGAGIYFGLWAVQSASFSVPADPYMSQIYGTRAMLSLPLAVLCVAVGILFFICVRRRPSPR